MKFNYILLFILSFFFFKFIMCSFCNGHEVDMFFAPRGIVLLVIICMYCNLLGGMKKKKMPGHLTTRTKSLS